MFGSSTPLAELSDWHPVHRANAALRAAMLSSTAHASERFQPLEDFSNLSATFETRAFPSADDALAIGEHEEVDEEDGEAVLELTDAAAFVGEDDDEAILELTDAEAFVGDATAALARTPRQAEMQALVADFQRRQRQVSLLVAGCIGISALVTVTALLLLASLTAFATQDLPSSTAPLLKQEDINLTHSTSITWQRPRASKPARLQHAGLVAPNARTITFGSGEQIALGGVLPHAQGRYLLLRGLPPSATLSAGLRNPSGAWIVKAEDLPGLTLSLGNNASGNYPLELYELGTGDQISARQSIVLSIRPEAPHIYAAGLDAGITMLLDMAVGDGAPLAEAQTAAPETPLLLARAERLLDEGDLAGAKLLLNYLAAHGEAEAAAALARKFDEKSSTLGARAHRAFQRAEADNAANSAERVKILASLSGRTPSD